MITVLRHISYNDMVMRMLRRADSCSERSSAADYQLFCNARKCLEETDLDLVSEMAGEVSELARNCGACVMAECIGTHLISKTRWLHNLRSASSWEQSRRIC